MRPQPTTIKAYAKRAMRPIAMPVLRLFYARVDARIAENLRAYEATSAAGTLTQHLPALLNAISAQNATARELRRTEQRFAGDMDELSAVTQRLAGEVTEMWGAAQANAQRIGQVEQRGEFVRRELLMTMRYQPGQASGHGIDDVIEPRIIDEAKVAAASPLRLNVGCGHLPLDGYVNVDGRELPGVDVLADARNLPFDPSSVDEIYAAHLVEHFPLDELEQVVLPTWRTALRPGGLLNLVVPDAGAMLDDYGAGKFSFEDLRLVTFGDQEYDGDFHFTMFTTGTLVELLQRMGFDDVEVVASGRPNGACLEMEVHATKPVTEVDTARAKHSS